MLPISLTQLPSSTTAVLKSVGVAPDVVDRSNKAQFVKPLASRRSDGEVEPDVPLGSGQLRMLAYLQVATRLIRVGGMGRIGAPQTFVLLS